MSYLLVAQANSHKSVVQVWPEKSPCLTLGVCIKYKMFVPGLRTAVTLKTHPGFDHLSHKYCSSEFCGLISILTQYKCELIYTYFIFSLVHVTDFVFLPFCFSCFAVLFLTQDFCNFITIVIPHKNSIETHQYLIISVKSNMW